MAEPHVLLIPSWYPTAEDPLAGVFFREQALVLRAAGARVGVVYPEFRSLRRVRPRALRANRFQSSIANEDGIPVLRFHGWNVLPRSVTGGSLWGFVAARLAARYIHIHGRPDVIHAHAALWGGVAAAKVAAATGAPYLVTEHFSGYTEQATGFTPGKLTSGQLAAASRAFSGADRVIAVSSALARTLIESGLVHAAQVRVIPNLVHTDFFTLPQRDRPRDGTFRLLCVGNLERIKGQAVLLHAFKRAFGSDSGVALEFVGAGPDRAVLDTLAGELGIRDRVRFLGALQRAGVRDAMWRAHLLVHPSFIETFGVVLIEALATGLPVVATDCGGPRDVIVPAVGELTPIGDADALARALRTARESHYSPQAIRQYAVDNFSAVRVARQLFDTYDALIGRRGGAARVDLLDVQSRGV